MVEIAKQVDAAAKVVEIIPPNRRRRSTDASVRCACCGKVPEPGNIASLEYGICDDCIRCP
jgi:hypothetical protein